MSASSSTVSSSELRRRFGHSREPIAVARLYARPAPFKQANIDVRSYIGFVLIGGILNMVQVNTYDKNDGNGEGMGKNFTPRYTPVNVEDPKRVQRSLKGYNVVDISTVNNGLMVAQTGTDGTRANEILDGILAWKPAPQTAGTTQNAENATGSDGEAPARTPKGNGKRATATA